MKTTYLRINPADNVAVAISPLHAGETIEADGRVITLRTDVPAGHKVTLKNFQAGENIIKYGYPIGHVTVDVPEGTWVSEKEIKTNLAGLLDYTYQPVEVHTDIPMEHRTFKGYRRRNGDVGVRNEIWIIPTVGCVNGIVNQLAEDFAAKRTEEKEWMPSWLFRIIMVARSWAKTMRIQRRFCATWCCIPMPEPCW